MIYELKGKKFITKMIQSTMFAVSRVYGNIEYRTKIWVARWWEECKGEWGEGKQKRGIMVVTRYKRAFKGSKRNFISRILALLGTHLSKRSRNFSSSRLSTLSPRTRASSHIPRIAHGR